MGSSIPMYFEGTPLHDDNFILPFSILTGQSVSVGNVVKQSTTAFAVESVSAATDFPLGVALTGGILDSGIAIVCRGVLDVVVDGAVTPGDYLVASTTAGEMHDNSTTAPTYGARVIALSSASSSGQVVQALFL